MNITYYTKCQEEGTRIATFGVFIPHWRMHINNLVILKGNDSGWYIALPTHKNFDTQTWEKTVDFEKDTSQKFLLAAKNAVEEHARKEGRTIL